jgi:hypothetical protein
MLLAIQIVSLSIGSGWEKDFMAHDYFKICSAVAVRILCQTKNFVIEKGMTMSTAAWLGYGSIIAAPNLLQNSYRGVSMDATILLLFVVAEGLGLLGFAQAVHFLGAARPSLPEGLLGAEMLMAFSEWHYWGGTWDDLRP